MLSLKTAKKLKDAGLKWEPQWGDVFNIPSVFSDGITMLMDVQDCKDAPWFICAE